MYEFNISTKIYSGKNSLRRLSDYKNKRICIVCDNFLITGGGIRKVLKQLDNSVTVDIFNKVVPDPPIEIIMDGVRLIGNFKPDIVIALGGGSAIDTAKGIVFAARQMNLVNIDLKLVAIPTTSGTGSEVTSVTVISDPSNDMKQIIHSPSILPEEAILDAELILSVNPEITANTGMDVFTHALEAYVATNANVFSDALVEKSIGLCVKSLLTCYFDGNNLDARMDMHNSSNLAGIAFDKAGLGLNHAIAHGIGGKLHITHGIANALVLNKVIDHNSKDKKIAKKYAELAKITNMVNSDSDTQFAIEVMKGYINCLKIIMKMPLTFRECGISLEQFEEGKHYIAENAIKDLCMNTNPISATKEDILSILESSY